jgi:hypothetical protein
VLATTAASYLETLNPEQRRAVEHGITADGHIGAPSWLSPALDPARRTRLLTASPI